MSITRIVQTEQERQLLLRYLQAHKLPFTAEIAAGRKRTLDQNRLQRLWVKEIAEQKPEHTAEEWRGHCKLHFGVPILRNENEEFRLAYDRVVKPLPYEQKLLAMMVPLDMPVTSIMTSKQKTAYLDQVHRQFSEQGVILTDPSGLLSSIERRAAA